MNLCSPQDCTGCLACVNVCPQQALKIDVDNEGFYVPSLNAEKCTECLLCQNRCPILNPVTNKSFKQYGYACWSKNEKIRKESSSGGVFTELATTILTENGVVYGAAFNEKLELEHIGVTTISELEKLRGSKYLQSNIQNTYYNIKKNLQKGNPVLFTGTPCQVAGLRSFLHKDYEKLITVDFVCHGVPSPLLFTKYKQWLENKYQSSIISYKFRDKKKSWQCYNTKAQFQSGECYIGSWFKDSFMRIFLRDYPLRNSCYHCSYTNMCRMGDLTIADFWGYKAQNKVQKNNDKGISMVLVNTPQGEAIISKAQDKLISFERTAHEISQSQKSLSKPWEKPTNRSEFWNDLINKPFEDIIKKWGFPQKRNFAQFLVSEYGRNKITNPMINIYYKFQGLKSILK